MPREPDIGWQHGKMIGGHRHHVQCNYCHRLMIGGITRFKKHLARKKGEIKGCEAVPQEVREMIKRHLAAGEVKRESQKREIKADVEHLDAEPSDDKDMQSDESDREKAAARLESLRALGKDEAHIPIVNEYKSDHRRFMVACREINDTFSSVSYKNEQGSAPLRAADPGWDHGMMVDGDRQKIKCKYCNKVILGGGISRLKQHLAGERGNIAPCEEVPEDVKRQMQQHLGFKVLERLKRQRELGIINGPSQEGREENSDDMQMSPNATSSRRRRGRRGKEVDEGTSHRRKKANKVFPSATPIPPSSIHLTFASQEIIDQADMAVAKFMYDAGIPFSAANSLYFQAMADAIAAVGPGYKMPTYHALRGKLLTKSVCEAQELSLELRKSWEVTGCTVIADRWTDKTGQSVIYFFLYCPKGTAFLKSVDASDIVETPEALMNLFDCIVQEIGPRNVVHFVTECSASFRAAGKLLMFKYKTLFWSACVTDCINLMLEDLGKWDGVKEVLAKAKRLSRFIYNHAWALDLMRKRTGGRDIVLPAITKSMTDFLTLQSIVSLRDLLHQMFTSTTWLESAVSKERVGVEVIGIASDPLFWSSCAKILKVTKALFTVLHVAESNGRPSMGYIYDAMEKARKCIIAAFNNTESEYLPYVNLIDHVWEEQLHSPLHAAAHFLNPSIFYNPSFSPTKVIQKGLLDCIETLEPDTTAQDMILKQIPFYDEAAGDFNRPVAVRGRETLSPATNECLYLKATWWSMYASDYRELQRFAVRILSQTCCGTRYERKWSIFERVHSNERNRLEQERLNDIIFVHYNLCRLQRHLATSGSKILIRGPYDPICLEEEGMNAGVGDWVGDPGVLKRDDLGWIDVAMPVNTFASNKVSSSDYHINSADDGSSNGSNGNFSSRDL
ncbi:hypothetical protein AAC387_Pa10g0407 [Persea americana]